MASELKPWHNMNLVMLGEDGQRDYFYPTEEGVINICKRYNIPHEPLLEMWRNADPSCHTIGVDVKIYRKAHNGK